MCVIFDVIVFKDFGINYTVVFAENVCKIVILVTVILT